MDCKFWDFSLRLPATAIKRRKLVPVHYRGVQKSMANHVISTLEIVVNRSPLLRVSLITLFCI
jgi:hypothetical protein